MGTGILTAICLTLAIGQGAGDVYYTNRRDRQIPVDVEDSQRANYREFLLYESTDQGRAWRQAGVIPANKAGFAYYAVGDGTYWFQVASVTKAGVQNPSDQAIMKGPPHLKMVIDTTKPIVNSFQATRVGDQIAVTWDLQDANPDLSRDAIRLEFHNKDALVESWKAVSIQGMKGQTTFNPGHKQPLVVRLTVRDLAKNESFSIAEIAGTVVAAGFVGQAPTPAPMAGPMFPGTITIPKEPVAEVRKPVLTGGPLTPNPSPGGRGENGPLTPNPSPGGRGENGPLTPNPSPGGRGENGPVTPNPSPGGRGENGPVTPNPSPPDGRGEYVKRPILPPPVGMNDPTPLNANPGALTLPAPGFPSPLGTDGVPEKVADSRTPPAPPQPDPVKMPGQFGPSQDQGADIKPLAHATPARKQLPMLQYVNQHLVKLQYEIKRQGPSGIGGIQIWLTRDDGATWSPYAEVKDLAHEAVQGRQERDFDFRDKHDAPFTDGVYGLILVVKNRAGLGREPRPGDAPEIRIELDTKAPVAQLFKPTLDPQNPTQLLLKWSAQDKNLGDAPIDLEYAEKRDGPWHPIEQNLKNTGRYANQFVTGDYSWKIPPATPVQVYLRLRVRDKAGNESIAVTGEPQFVDLVEPEGALIGIVPQTRRP